MLIATVFIAELIIAIQLISLIIKADKKILAINDCIKEFNPLAKTCMQYIRCLALSFSTNVKKGIDFIEKQREKIILRAITTATLYGILLLFRLKRIKMRKIGKLACAIRDIILDFVI